MSLSIPRSLAAALVALELLLGLGSAGCSGQPWGRWDEMGPSTLAGFPPTQVPAEAPDPPDDRRILKGLTSPDADARVEALRAWAETRAATLPPAVAESLRDPDPRVRTAALRAVARRRPAGVERFLAAALEDHDLPVRLAAIAALGQVGGAEAQAKLERLAADRGELVRAAVVSGLAAMDARQPVLHAKGDASWRVRLEVARALARYCDRDGEAAARDLLSDPSPAVQLQVLASVGNWPLERSGPLLLEGMSKAAYKTRQTAARQLAALWPPAAGFPVDGAPHEREKTLRQLEVRYREQFRAASAAAAEAEARTADPSGHSMPPELAAELQRLKSEDVTVRRRAADRLAQQARERPLGRAATTELASVAVRESDSLVWRGILATVSGDGSEPAARLAYAAIGHPSAEVRRAACEHLAAHPSPKHAQVLLPALEDPNVGVAGAAARALGAGGRLDDTEPLKRLLGSRNELVRVEAAAALARLGDPSGPAALERLAYSTDPAVRRHVALAMGQAADPTFVPTLVRLLDDQYAVRLAALESLPKVAGHEAAESRETAPRSVADQVVFWKTLLRTRQTVAGRGQ